MYEIAVLGSPECLQALRAMLDSGPAVEKGRIAMAVVDEYGDLMAFARMDGASPAVRDFAVRKAYTAARMRSHLKDFRAGLEKRGRTVADYGDRKLVGMAAGGLAISDASGTVLGAIGVSGSTPEEDEAIAQSGLQALLAAMEGS